jgi:hypothetical protein
MSETIEKKLARLTQQATVRMKIAEQKTDLEGPVEETINHPARKTGKSARSIMRDAEATLRRFAEEVGIEQFDLFPGREYPTLFTRVPLFPPMQRSRAREQQALATKKSDFVRLKSRWDKGGVYRSGPALTVVDEDTLAGLLQLRSIGFSGNELLMPSKKMGGKNEMILSGGKNVVVHAVYCIVSELETLIKGREPPKKGWSGTVIKRRRESIERLAATNLRFEQPKGLDMYRGKIIPIIELDWVGSKDNACYYVQFHPAIVKWLEDYRSYINLDIRRELTPFGKALHRFLSSQTSNTTYNVDFEVLLEAIGYEGRIGEAKRHAVGQLKKLIELDFIKEYFFAGNGRKDPYQLSVRFR